MPSGWASAAGTQLAVLIHRLAITPLGAYDPAQVPWLGGGRLTGAVHAPATTGEPSVRSGHGAS